MNIMMHRWAYHYIMDSCVELQSLRLLNMSLCGNLNLNMNQLEWHTNEFPELRIHRLIIKALAQYTWHRKNNAVIQTHNFFQQPPMFNNEILTKAVPLSVVVWVS